MSKIAIKCASFVLPFFCFSAANAGPINFFTEDFESFAQGPTACFGTQTLSNGWLNDTGDNLDFVADSGRTPSGSTGPNGVDSNPGSSTGKYLYMETSCNSNGNIANLLSPIFDLSARNGTGVSFAYHMYGATNGSLHFDTSLNGGTSFTNDFEAAIVGNQGNQWLVKTIDLSQFDGEIAFRLRLRGISGASFTGDIALDDFQFFADSTVPAPATLALMGLGLAGLGWKRRRKA
jgi:hypothetical protein